MNSSVTTEPDNTNLDFMIETPIPKLVVKMAIPTVISMLVMSVYSISDMFFVSRLGTAASAAVGIVFSIMTMIQAVGNMLGIGAGSLISRKLGEGKQKDADSIASVAFFSAIFGGIIVLILGIIFKTELMNFLGATSTILPYAEDFAHYILIASPIMCGSFVLNILLRSQGKAKMSMIGLSVGGILNIILDPIFIFGLKMGIGGAAVATFISQLIGFIILLFIYKNQKNLVKIDFALFIPSFFIFISKICTVGSASLLRQGLVVIANVLLNVFARRYGDAAIAGMTITSRVFMIVISIMFGIGQGFQPVAGFCFGAKRFDRVKYSYFFTIFISILVQLVFACVLYFFAKEIVQIFQKDIEVVNIGTDAIRFYALSLPFLPLSVVTNMLFQVTGQTRQSVFLSSCRQGFFFLPLIFILPHFIGLTGIELCQPISNILSGLISLPFVFLFFRRIHSGF